MSDSAQLLIDVAAKEDGVGSAAEELLGMADAYDKVGR